MVSSVYGSRLRSTIGIGVLNLFIVASLGPEAQADLRQPRVEHTDKARQLAVKWIDSNQSRITEMSDTIWRYAEPPFEEFQTYLLLTTALRNEGFSVEEHVAGLPTAFVASFSQGSGQPVIGIVTEYDTPTAGGLSQQAGAAERIELVPGDYGHACGHNMIAASSAAAVVAIKQAMVAEGLSGTIKLFGAPAEEELTGKVYMVDAGLFNGLDAALAWHPGPNFEARYGINTALRRVKFRFTGDSTDQALTAALKFKDLADVTNPTLTLRGNTVEARVSVSAPTFVESERLIDDIRADAMRVAQQTGTQVQEQLVIGTRERLPNERLVQLMDQTMRQLGTPEYTRSEIEFATRISKTFENPPPASELMPRLLPPSRAIGSANDNADVSWVAPFISVRGGTYVNGITAHTWQQTSLAASSIGHKGLVTMAKVLATAALTLFTTPSLRAEIREEFGNKTRGHTYRAALPQHRNWRAVRR